MRIVFGEAKEKTPGLYAGDEGEIMSIKSGISGNLVFTVKWDKGIKSVLYGDTDKFTTYKKIDDNNVIHS